MGEVIANRYEVLSGLGSGALGDVMKVWDRTDQAVRALKLLKPVTPGDSGFGRFQREFAAISRLEHPNIIKVFTFGMEGERPYFSMEFLEGTELGPYAVSNRPAEGMPGFEEFARKIAYVFHQVSDALAVVHEAGVIHRDLKPPNIFVKSGRFPRAKLLDFGHARDDDEKNLTQTGTVLGTAHYIPPEQAMARGVGPEADMYAMGCVMFECLAGQPPYPGRSVIDVLMGHIRKPVPDITETEPRTPEILRDLCMELMQKEPPGRPAATTVAKLLADV